MAGEFIVFRTVSKDPELLRIYSDLIKFGPSSANSKQLQDAIEVSFGKLFKSKPRLGSERLVPDLALSEAAWNKAASQVLGTKVTDAELKFKRGSSKKLKDTEIGSIRLTEEIKKTATREVQAKDLDDNAVKKLNMDRGKKLLDAIKKTSDGPLFYNKSKFLSISKMVDGKVETLNVLTPPDLFDVPPFFVRYSRTEDKIYLSLSSTFEKNLLKEVQNVTVLTAKDGLENLKKAFNEFARTKTTVKTVKGIKQFSIAVPTGGSIPMARAAIARTKKKRDAEGRERGRFISKAQLTAILRRRVQEQMPKGPRRGPPLSDDVLTYRTGRFVRSINVALLNYKTSIINYFYDPVYRVHEETSRDPRELIEDTIREVVQRRFAREFNIVRV
jgi:hypothetical protein